MSLWCILAVAASGILIAAAPALAEERAPEVTPGGTVVLRGSTPGLSNALSTTPAAQPVVGSSSFEWDTGGFDRRFDWRFDRSGLTPHLAVPP